MNDADFDRLLTDALAWRANQHIAQRTPRRLAMRQLAVRLGTTGVEVRSKLLRSPDRVVSRVERGRRFVGQFAGIAAALVVAVLVASYVFGPGSQGGATGPQHESVGHGYSLRLLDGNWTVTEYPGQWQPSEFLNAESPGSDYFARRPSAPQQVLAYMWMSSQAIPDGMTFDGWLYLQDGVTSASASCFDLQGEYQRIQLDGESARVGVYRCANFGDSGVAWATVQVLFSHDGRGYAMYFWPEQEPEMAPLDDVRREALRWLTTFRFLEPGPTNA